MGDGTQVVIISLASGKALTVADDVDGARIQQKFHVSGQVGTLPGQAWTLVPVGPTTGVFKIVSVLTGKLLDVRRSSTEDHAEILQYHGNGGANQHWQLELMDPPATQFAFTIISEHSGKVLDVPLDEIEEDGAFIQQYTFNGGQNQRWILAFAPPFSPD